MIEQSGPKRDFLAEEDVPADLVLFGTSRAMSEVKRRADMLAATRLPVLIRGESGTGKEVMAKYIHLHSDRRGGPFIRVNCAAIPSTLLESELFGYEKGSFTGAVQSRPGLVKQSSGGTLFLDEIGEMQPELQSKLLRFLQDYSYYSIGDCEIKFADVRVVCATNCKLEEAIQENQFRQDLFYRIDVVALQLPPLRERRQDIRALAVYFAGIASQRFGRSVPTLKEETLRLMERWYWPGNIREFENWMMRYVVIGNEEAMAQQLTQKLEQSEQVAPLKMIAKAAMLAKQRHMILESLEAHHWNRRKVAKELQISYRALLYKIRETGLSE